MRRAFIREKHVRGFSLLEFLIALAIGLLLIVGVSRVFLLFDRESVLAREAREVRTILEDARSRTLLSKGDTQYGVHLESSQVTLFSGDVYTAGDPNNETSLLSERVMLSHELSGGGDDVVFVRLTGEAFPYGTTTLLLSGDPASSASIVVLPSGLIELSE